MNRGPYINTVAHCNIMLTDPKELGIPVLSVVYSTVKLYKPFIEVAKNTSL